jgi:hypothetical protein
MIVLLGSPQAHNLIATLVKHYTGAVAYGCTAIATAPCINGGTMIRNVCKHFHRTTISRWLDTSM